MRVFVGLQPIVILTKADEIRESGLEGHFEDIYNVGTIDVAIETFCTSTRIPRAFVFPAVNYTGPFKLPNVVLQKLCLNAADAVLTQAFAKVRKELSKVITLTDAATKAKLGQVIFTQGFEMPLDAIRPRVFNSLGPFSFVRPNGLVVLTEQEQILKISSCLVYSSDTAAQLLVSTSASAHSPAPSPAKNSTNNNNSNNNNSTVGPVKLTIQADGASVGFLLDISLGSSLSSLRKEMTEEEVGPSYTYVFFDQSGNEVKDEATTTVGQCALITEGKRFVNVGRKVL